MDLNADVGEGADDEPLLEFVSSVNVACGVHAGDEETMLRIVKAAADRGCSVGAHPGYADREGAGRVAMTLGHDEVVGLIADQVRTLATVAIRFGVRLTHVKPHGALYNQAAVDEGLAKAIVRGVARAGRTLRVVGLAGSALPRAAEQAGLRATHEAFADRRYTPAGTLAPRTESGAVIEDPSQAAAQALAIARGEPIPGTNLSVHAQTICLHGDNPRAAEVALSVSRALAEAGIEVAPLR